MEEVYKKYSLDDNTSDFVGHALALFRDDEYKSKPCLEAIKRKLLFILTIFKISRGELSRENGLSLPQNSYKPSLNQRRPSFFGRRGGGEK